MRDDEKSKAQLIEELRESEERFGLLAGNIADIVWTLDRDLRTTFVSPSIESVLGYTPEERKRQTLEEMVAPESLRTVVTMFADEIGRDEHEEVDPGRHLFVEVEYYHADGHTLWMENKVRALRDETGTIVGLLGSSRDITEQKRTVERIDGLNRLKEDLFAPGSLNEKMKRITDGVIALLDADFARIWLTKPGDMCNSGCMHDSVREGPHVCRDRDRCLHLVASSGRYTRTDGTHERVPFGCYKVGRVAADEEPGFLTNDVRHDSRVHNHKWALDLGLISFAGYRLLSRKGLPIGVLALFSKRALSPGEEALVQTIAGTASSVFLASQSDDALRESEERLQGVFNSVTDQLMLLDLDHRIQMINRAEPGLDREAALGSPLYELVGAEDRDLVKSLLDRVVQGAEPQAYDTSYLRPDGSTAHFSSIAAPISVAGEVTGSVVSSREVTDQIRLEAERDQLEEQYRQSQKMEAIGRLAGGVAHDFNNVLCGIMGSAELALLDMSASDPLRLAMEQILQAVNRANNLTAQLLAFSRKQVIEPRVLNLSQLIEDLHPMLVRLIGEDIVLQTAPQKELGLVRADPGQVEQIVLNLAVNARDAMPSGGNLIIETSDVVLDEGYCDSHANARPGVYVMLAMSDTGVGMSAEILDKIFEPFFTTKELGRGTGLGLATVYGIVEKNGGRIEAYSEEGRGSSFKIYFPRVEEEAETLRSSVVPDAVGGNETVLVVEDEEMVRSMATNILERSGYNVLAAASGTEALALAQRHEGPIDLLFTDVVMPRMNGREVAENLAELRPGIQVLYTSGYTQNVIAHHGVLEEGVQFVAKPYSNNTLTARVREVLDRGQAKKARRGEDGTADS